jgi:flavorubredoxin
VILVALVIIICYNIRGFTIIYFLITRGLPIMELIPQPFMAQKVSENVYWVGAIDWSLTDFHGYKTDRGTTYNAFLIIADKITLVDTVKKPYKEEMLYRIASVIDPKKIDYIVSNHAEMDHSGSIPDIIEAVKPEKVFASTNGVTALNAHFSSIQNIEAVENGGTIDLGNMALTCIETKMIHWPDSMVSYLAEDKLLFAQDAFGMHLATTKLFADENDRDVMLWEATKYYANIVLPYSKIVGKTVEALLGLNLPIDIIAPDHGPLWRTPEDIGWIIECYQKWITQKPTNKAVIVYDTMWNSTALMARVIAEGVKAAGSEAIVMPMSSAHRSDVITEVINAGALIAGTTTMNSGVFPSMADVLTYIRGLKPANLIGASFGSYGWNTKALKELDGYMDAIGVEMVADQITVQFVPEKEDLMNCFELGKTVAQELQKRCN